MPCAETHGAFFFSDDIVVYITPAPIFAAFERLNNRMFGFVKMFGRVFVFGLVAAADVSASETQT